MKISIYALPPILVSLFLLGLVYIILRHSPKRALNIVLSLVCIGGSIWLSCIGLIYIFAENKFLIDFFAKMVHVGSTFIIFFYFYFTHSFLKIKNKIPIICSGIIATIFIILFLTTNLLLNGFYNFYWGAYPKATKWHLIYLSYAIGSFMYCLILLFKASKNKQYSPLEIVRIKYVFWAYLFGNIAAIDWIPNYGLEIYPFGYINILIFTTIITLAIIRYRLMDIKVAITRAGLFIAVYTLVLGLPFAVAVWFKDWFIERFGASWWMAPLGLMALLATAGPFIYIFLERRAEDRLLREQRNYQNTLKQASVGMTRIRNLRKLLDLITHIVTKTVKISYAAIYLYNKETDEFVLQVSRDKGRMPIPKLTSDNSLISWVTVHREPLIYEEVKRQMEDTNNVTYKLLEENMRLLTASVVIPSFLEDRFMGFFVLGDKNSGQIYTLDDLNVFQVLASQAALAIENAQFYEEAKEMQEQIAQAEKMATIGTMADGLSHQINNRFYALSLIAGDTIDTIKLTDTAKCTPEVKEMINQINHALERIQSNVLQGGEVVRGLLKYSRKGDAAFEALDLNTVLDNTLEMVQYKVKLSEIDIIRDFKDPPKIKGNMTQLEEVFFNFIDNAYDAIVERRTGLQEVGYHGRITISAHPKDESIEITVEDNGMGIKDTNNEKVFTPFFTTKTSSRKGTGLGLYVIRRIITDTHKGKVSFESDYKVGTRFILELPIAK